MLVYFNFWCESIVIIFLCSWAKRTLQSLVECTETRGMVPFKTSRQVFFFFFNHFQFSRGLRWLHCTVNNAVPSLHTFLFRLRCRLPLQWLFLLWNGWTPLLFRRYCRKSSVSRLFSWMQTRWNISVSTGLSATCCSSTCPTVQSKRVFFLMLKHKMPKEAKHAISLVYF